MSILIMHTPEIVKKPAFGKTMQEAKSNAEMLLEKISNIKSYATLEDSGDKLNNGFYGWMVNSHEAIYR